MDDQRMKGVPTQCLQEADKRARERFRMVNLEHPVMEKLFAVSKEFTARDLAEAPDRQAPRSSGSPGVPRRPAESLESSLTLGPLEVLVSEIKLPAVPQVLLELLQLLEDQSSSARDLADVIRLDTGLASTLLRIVNSAYYSFPFPIDTIDRAVTLLGTREIASLALSSTFLKMFKESPARFIPLESFWKHSICCGSAARIVAQRCGLSNPERHFLAGLLHDIGRLVMFVHLPELSEELMAVAYWKDVSLRQAELEVLGYDHGRFGASLLANWNFPKTLTMAVQHHHDPGEGMGFDEPRCVHLANIISTTLGAGSSGDDLVPPLDTLAWQELDLDIETLPEIVDSIHKELKTLLSPLTQ